MTQLDRTIAPATTSYGHLEMPAATIETLPNGIETRIIDCGSVEANRISVIWSKGSSASASDAYGASVLPGMLQQGCASMTGEEIADTIDFHGAFLNHNVQSGHTRFTLLSLNEFTPRLTDILADILTTPTFPADRLEATKREGLTALRTNRTRTGYRATEALSRLLAGPGHPYKQPLTEDIIRNTTVETLRRLWEQGIGQSKIYIIASGKIDKNIAASIRRLAERIRPEAVECQTDPVVPDSPSAPGLEVVEMPEARQSSLSIGIPTIARTHPDYIPLRIAVMALGGYFGSRLMTNIREEKGLTYGINAYLAGTREGSSANIRADFDPAYTNTVLNEINHEIIRLSRQAMGTEEFERLIRYYGTTLASTIDSFRAIGDYYDTMITIGTPSDYFEMQQRVVETITPDDIMRVCARYLHPEAERIVIAGRKA